MPYFLEVNNPDYSYPKICPFCEEKDADTIVEMKKERTTGYYVVARRVKTYVIPVPACSQCARKRNNLAVLSMAWLLIAIAALVVAGLYDLGTVLLYLLGGGVFMGLVFLVNRFLKFRHMGIAYINDDEIVFSVTSHSYALRFSALNKCSIKQSILYFRPT